MNIAVSSQSKLKCKAIYTYMVDKYGSDTTVKGFKIPKVEMAEQPIDTITQNNGLLGAQRRIEALLQLDEIKNDSTFNYLLAIENSITKAIYSTYKNDLGELVPTENCNIVLYDIENEREYISVLRTPLSYNSKIINNAIDLASDRTPDNYIFKDFGLSVTIGSILKETNDLVNPKNWIEHFSGHIEAERIDRQIQIGYALQSITTCLSARKLIKIVPDFPKIGVNFADMSPLLADPYVSRDLIRCYCNNVSNPDKINISDIDCVVGLDSRGFIFGSQIAFELQKPFVMVRKAGKLPYSKSEGPKENETKNEETDDKPIAYTYTTEYSTDTFEISKRSLQIKGKAPEYKVRVLIVDDILATGGSAYAAAKLVEKAGGTVSGIIVLLDVPSLRNEAEEILEKYRVTVML